MPKFKEEYRKLLEPFGEIFYQMGDQIFNMPEADLNALSAAVDAASTGNCWCMIYDAAKWLRIQIDDEFRRRAFVSRSGESNG